MQFKEKEPWQPSEMSVATHKEEYLLKGQKLHRADKTLTFEQTPGQAKDSVSLRIEKKF